MVFFFTGGALKLVYAARRGPSDGIVPLLVIPLDRIGDLDPGVYRLLRADANSASVTTYEEQALDRSLNRGF